MAERSSGSEEARAFLQKRVATFGLAISIISVVALIFRALGLFFYTGSKLDEEIRFALLAHVAGMAISVAIWMYNRQGVRSERAIQRSESLGLAAAGAAYVLSGLVIPMVGRPDLLIGEFLMALMFVRTIYVPCTARHTLMVGVGLAIPFLAMVTYLVSKPDAYLELAGRELDLQDLTTVRAMILGMNIFAIIIGVAACAAASRVIYGLRKEVRDVKKLGQYSLEEKLGEGGLGVVYRASHALLRRPTAVKLLPPDRAAERDLLRFEREVQLTARLSHPNTVTVFDYGRTPDNVFYYAMELIEGLSLQDLVELDGAQPPARVIHVLIQAAGALAEAHAVGLIHRDVKPANLMLCERGGIPDTVKVLDFGLVKDTRAADPGLSHFDVVTGTPMYLPPEAIRAPDTVGAQSDLYSLGAVGYFLLTGRHVFTGATAVEVCSHHLHTKPTPPQELVSAPADLSAILLRCLEKDPSARPHSAEALQADLHSCADAGKWSREDARRWWKDRARDR